MQVRILKNKNPCKAFAYKGLAQAVRFELTCLYGKLISSQPRYDHFDTLAYLVRLEENPLDFPLDKVLKIERQEAMKPDGKRVCQNVVSDISARFRVSPVMTTSIRLRI